MKKVFSVLVGVALALCITVLGPREAHAQDGMAKLVPQDAVFFKTSVDVENMWDIIVKSNFWKSVTSLKVWDDSGARAGLQSFAEQFKENVGVELTKENIMSLLGKEIAVGVCVQPGDTPNIQGYLMFRGNPKAKAEEVIGKLDGILRKHAEQAGEEAFKDAVYKGTKITTLKAEEMPVEIQYGFIDDIFALGIGTGSAELNKIVDLAGGTGESLASNANFQKIVAASKMSNGKYAGTFYADLQKVGQIFAGMDESHFPAAMQPIMMSLKQSLSMPMVVGGTGYLDQGEVIRLVSMPVGEMTNKLMEMGLKASPAAGTNLKYIPADSVAYVGMNSMPDPQEMWPLLLEQWEEQGAMPAMNMIFGQIEGAFGIKIADDVIPWVGNEVAMLFSDIDTKPGFPYPKFAAMVKIKDMGKAKAFLTKIDAVVKELVEQTGFQFKPVAYGGQSFNSVAISMPMPMPISLTPAYGIVDDFMVIGSNDDLIKQMIDASKGQAKDIAANPAFKAMNIPAQTTATFFGDWGKLMGSLKSVAAWVVQFTEAQPMGESIKGVVETHVVPIANVLSALQTMGGYQLNQGNMSVATYIIRVKDLPGS